jgi:hypothetical protein
LIVDGEYFASYVRILRINNNPVSPEPVAINGGAANSVTVSVNPANNLIATLFQLSNGTSLSSSAPGSGVTIAPLSGNSIQTINLSAPTTVAGQTYLLRIAVGGGIPACEIELQT